MDPAPAGGGRPAVHLQRAPGSPGSLLAPRVVVGADGLRSVVVRSLDLVARPPRLRKVSLTAHVSGPGLPVGHGILSVSPGLTVGAAPVDAGGSGPRWNVTVVTPTGEGVAPEAGSFLLASAARALPGLGPLTLLDGPWASGPFDWPVRRCWAPGVALVGDAAGYFDPFTGQGVYRALRSAELAAHALDRTLRTPASGTDWSALADYDEAWTRAVRMRRWVQRGVEAVMARPWLRDRVVPALGAAGALNGVVRLTGDVADPASVR